MSEEEKIEVTFNAPEGEDPYGMNQERANRTSKMLNDIIKGFDKTRDVDRWTAFEQAIAAQAAAYAIVKMGHMPMSIMLQMQLNASVLADGAVECWRAIQAEVEGKSRKEGEDVDQPS